MDRKEAILRIKDHMEHHGIGKYPHLKLKEALDMVIAALSQPNEPLTLEQLREMDGEPVYVHNLFPAKRKFEWQWALVCKERGNAEATTYTYRFLDYGKTWIAYRRPPEVQS